LKNKIMTFVFAVVLGAPSLTCWLKPQTAFSESERRLLAEKPENIELLTLEEAVLRCL